MPEPQGPKRIRGECPQCGAGEVTLRRNYVYVRPCSKCGPLDPALPSGTFRRDDVTLESPQSEAQGPSAEERLHEAAEDRLAIYRFAFLDGYIVQERDARTVARLHASAAVAEARERVELHMHRMLALVGRALEGQHVSKEFGGNAPEDVQGLLDAAFTVHRERDEAVAAVAELTRERDEADVQAAELLADRNTAEIERDAAREREDRLSAQLGRTEHNYQRATVRAKRAEGHIADLRCALDRATGEGAYWNLKYRTAEAEVGRLREALRAGAEALASVADVEGCDGEGNCQCGHCATLNRMDAALQSPEPESEETNDDE